MEKQFDGLNTTLIHQLKKKIEDLEKSEKLFSDLYKTGMTFGGTSDEILNAICLNVHKIFDGYFVLVNYAKGCEFHFRAGFNLPKAVLALKKEPIKNAICSHVLETKKPLFINDLKNTKCPHCNTPYSKDGAVKAFDLNTYFGVPLIFSDGSIRGTLCIVFKEKKEPFSEKDTNILSLFAKRISIELEREIVQNELNEEKERYTELFEQSNDGIILSDFNGKIFGANKKMGEITGYSEKELLGTRIWQLIPKSEKKIVGESFRRVLKNKSEFVESKLLKKDGRIVEINVYAKVITLKEGSFVQAILRDVTEKKKAEDALKESEEKYRAIFENAGEGILIADAKTKRFAFANPRICRILGYKEKELLKLKVNNIHPKKDLPHVMDQFKKQLQKKILTASSLPVLRKDKKVIFCDVTATPLIINGKECLAGFFLEK